MPLTSKGEKILAEMKAEYGAEKGERVFYASKNAGTITGVDTDEVLDSAVATMAQLGGRTLDDACRLMDAMSSSGFQAIKMELENAEDALDKARRRHGVGSSEFDEAKEYRDKIRRKMQEALKSDAASPGQIGVWQVKLEDVVRRLGSLQDNIAVARSLGRNVEAKEKEADRLASEEEALRKKLPNGGYYRGDARSDAGDIKIVYNKLLGGWYVVRGPHQTPLNGRFNSKEEAQAWLNKRTDAAPKFTKGQVINNPRNTYTSAGGESAPVEKIVITNPNGDMRHGSRIVDFEVHYSPDTQKKFHVKAIEYHWDYEDHIR
jgi:hypothetical protein